MGKVLSLFEEEEVYAPGYNNPQEYQTQRSTQRSLYAKTSKYTSTEDEATRQSYERSRYKRSKREKLKRKELENYELEQEEYLRKLREQESLERFKIRDERDRKSRGDDDYGGVYESYQISDIIDEQNSGLENNRDVRQNVGYGEIYRIQVIDKL